MGVKFKTTKNNIPQMQKSFKVLDGKKVQVGVLEGEHKWLAGIHEYGCNIPVTQKMRSYLAAQGLYLKKTTTVIHIPERSFLRSGFDDRHERAVEQAERMISTGLFDADEVCAFVGQYLSQQIKLFARDLDSPANHLFTVEQKKGKSNPLVDTGDMINGISYRVE